ncbi:MAG: NADH:ubiquinone oxidoreductase subunit N, partial [Pseudomarimonas sp.]
MSSIPNLQPMVPELFLLGATFSLLLIDLFVSQARRGLTHFLALVVLLVTLTLTLRGGDGVAVSTFGGMFLKDAPSDILKAFILVTTAATFIYAKQYLIDRGLFKGEFYV